MDVYGQFHIITWQKELGTHWMEGGMDYGPSLDMVAKTKIPSFPLLILNHGRPAYSTVAILSYWSNNVLADLYKSVSLVM